MTPPPALILGTGTMFVLSVVLVICAVLLFAIGLDSRRGSDDPDDQGSGPGRGGPDLPPSPETGPSAGEPPWWPEFERQFADYLERADDGSSRRPARGRHS